MSTVCLDAWMLVCAALVLACLYLHPTLTIAVLSCSILVITTLAPPAAAADDDDEPADEADGVSARRAELARGAAHANPAYRGAPDEAGGDGSRDCSVSETLEWAGASAAGCRKWRSAETEARRMRSFAEEMRANRRQNARAPPADAAAPSATHAGT
jgi:hypothetical protein